MTDDVAFELPLLGRPCRVFGADQKQEQWLRRYWQFGRIKTDPYPLVISIRFMRGAPNELIGAPRTRFITPLHRINLVWRQHDEHWWSTGGPVQGVQLRIAANAANIDVWGTHESQCLPILELALQVAICEALRTTGLAALHAAIIARGDQATALTGRRGVGKSTTLLHAMEKGWLPVAEDFAWLDLNTQRVYGWDRGVRLTEQGAARFMHRWPRAEWRRDSDGKLFLGYEMLAPSKPLEARLTCVAALRQDFSRASEWEPLWPHEAIRVLFECAGVPLSRDNRANFAARVPKLLRELDIARLVIGRTALPL